MVSFIPYRFVADVTNSSPPGQLAHRRSKCSRRLKAKMNRLRSSRNSKHPSKPLLTTSNYEPHDTGAIDYPV
jgi:hypothetical protein